MALLNTGDLQAEADDMRMSRLEMAASMIITARSQMNLAMNIIAEEIEAQGGSEAARALGLSAFGGEQAAGAADPQNGSQVPSPPPAPLSRSQIPTPGINGSRTSRAVHTFDKDEPSEAQGATTSSTGGE
jgi:hypothetical protein